MSTEIYISDEEWASNLNRELQELKPYNARMYAALSLAAVTFQRYAELHAAKPDHDKAAANYDLAYKMRCAMDPEGAS